MDSVERSTENQGIEQCRECYHLYNRGERVYSYLHKIFL